MDRVLLLALGTLVGNSLGLTLAAKRGKLLVTRRVGEDFVEVSNSSLTRRVTIKCLRHLKQVPLGYRPNGSEIHSLYA